MMLKEPKIEKTGHSPENERSRQPISSEKEVSYFRTSFREIVFKAKKLLEGLVVGPGTPEEGAAFKVAEDVFNKFGSISQATACFFRSLAPTSLHTPSQRHDHQERLSVLDAQGSDVVKRAIQTLKQKETGDPSYEGGGIRGEIKKKQIGPREIETQVNIIPQSVGGNYIVESLTNEFLSLSEMRVNLAAAKIFVSDGKSFVLNLNELLPQKGSFTTTSFAPASLMKFEPHFDKEKNEELAHPVLTNLASYEGMASNTGSESGFAHSPEINRVLYEDLGKKGGMLSLLHEVSHAWQEAYYGRFGKSKFLEFVNGVIPNLAALSHVRKSLRKEYPELKEEDLFAPIIKELAELGVEVDLENFDLEKAPGQTPRDSIGLQSDIFNKSFTVQSPRAKYLIEDFVRQERDAWAHGLRVLRFLRKHGIDLEPELKTAADLKNSIDPCLTSYQVFLEKNVKPSKGLRKFIR